VTARQTPKRILSVAGGSVAVGSIIKRHGSFIAYDASGALVGKYESQSPKGPRASCLARACDEPPRNSLGRSVQGRSKRVLPDSHGRDDSVQIGRWLKKTSTDHVAIRSAARSCRRYGVAIT